MTTIDNDHTHNNSAFQFDVAVSFAEEDRKFVDKVVRLLKRRKIKVFYDKDAMVDTWGRNMYVHLDDIYRTKARYCVMFISRHYKKKRWTQHERDSAQARASLLANRQYILPFRFDDTEIEGLWDTISYLPINDYDEKKLADAIVAKLKASQDQQAPPALYASGNIGLSPIKRTGRFLRQRMKVIMATSLSGIALVALSFTDMLTPVDTLTKRLHEQSRRAINVAICRDGWLSRSHGSGTCSHHGGIDHYQDSAVYDKTLEECRKEAEKISWFP